MSFGLFIGVYVLFDQMVTSSTKLPHVVPRPKARKPKKPKCSRVFPSIFIKRSPRLMDFNRVSC